MAGKLYNLARVTTATVGTGTITLGSAVAPFLTFAQAGVADGDVVAYSILDGTANSEIGTGTYTAAGPTLTRTVTKSTNSNTAISLSGSAQVIITARAEDIISVTLSQTFTDTEKAQARANIYAAPFDALAYNGMQVDGSGDVSQINGTTQLTLVSDTETYVTDTWQAAYKNSGAVVKARQLAAASFPATLSGYSNAVEMKATTALASLANGDYAKHMMVIVGYRIARLGMGVSGAQSFSYGFQYYSPRNATICVKVSNNTRGRCYYDEKAVVTGWNWVTGTIAGDTTGTWEIGNLIGIRFEVLSAGKSAAAATAGAWGTTNTTASSGMTQNNLSAINDACDVTGFKFLPGIELPSSTRAPFIMRPFALELAACRSLFEKSYDYGTAIGAVTNNGMHWIFSSSIATQAGGTIYYKEKKIALPTMTFYSPNTGASAKAYDFQATADVATSVNNNGDASYNWYVTKSNLATNVGAHWTADSRL